MENETKCILIHLGMNIAFQCRPFGYASSSMSSRFVIFVLNGHNFSGQNRNLMFEIGVASIKTVHGILIIHPNARKRFHPELHADA